MNLFNWIVTKFNMGTLKILPISQAISSWSASLLKRKKANKGLLMLLFGSWENKLQLCIRTTLQAATTLGTMATEIVILATWFRKWSPGWRWQKIDTWWNKNNLLFELYWNCKVLPRVFQSEKMRRCRQYSFKRKLMVGFLLIPILFCST